MSHVHRDSRGVLHRCYHECKNRWVPALVVATLAFPVEHWLWENAPILSDVWSRL